MEMNEKGVGTKTVDMEPLELKKGTTPEEQAKIQEALEKEQAEQKAAKLAELGSFGREHNGEVIDIRKYMPIGFNGNGVSQSKEKNPTLNRRERRLRESKKGQKFLARRNRLSAAAFQADLRKRQIAAGFNPDRPYDITEKEANDIVQLLSEPSLRAKSLDMVSQINRLEVKVNEIVNSKILDQMDETKKAKAVEVLTKGKFLEADGTVKIKTFAQVVAGNAMVREVNPDHVMTEDSLLIRLGTIQDELQERILSHIKQLPPLTPEEQKELDEQMEALKKAQAEQAKTEQEIKKD